MMNSHPVPKGAQSAPRRPLGRSMGAVEQRRVQRDRIGQIVIAHEFRDKGLAHRSIERADAPHEPGKHVHLPQRDKPRKNQQPRPMPVAAIAGCPWQTAAQRSARSATAPTKGISTIGGPNWSAITTPTAVPLCWVNWVSTSQSWAMRCIHVPMLETNEPAAQTR